MSVSISGILLDPLGQPASFAEVKFITWQGANDVLTTAPAVFKTSADGAYSFAVEFATYTVQVRYNQSNGKFQTIKQKVIVNSNTSASTLGELLLFNEPLTPPEIAYVEQLVAEAEGYRDEAEGFALASEASSQTSEGFSQASSGYADDANQSAIDAANSAALIAPIPLNGGVWASGQTYDFYNQYMIYNGEAYSPLPATALPYTVGAVPDLGFVYQIKLNSLQALSGLTEASDLDKVMSRYFSDLTEMLAFDDLNIDSIYSTGFAVWRSKVNGTPASYSDFDLLTDITAEEVGSLNLAIEISNHNGGGKVFTSGDTAGPVTLLSNVTISGLQSAKLTLPGSANATTLKADLQVNIGIENIEVDSNESNQSLGEYYGIEFKNCKNVSLLNVNSHDSVYPNLKIFECENVICDNVTLSKSPADGLKITNSKNVKIKNLTASNYPFIETHAIIGAVAAIQIDDGSENIELNNVILDAVQQLSATAGLDVSSHPGEGITKNVTVTNLKTTGFGSGLSVKSASENVTVTNHISFEDRISLAINTCKNVTVNNVNYTSDNSVPFTGTRYGIATSGEPEKVTINGGVVSRHGAAVYNDAACTSLKAFKVNDVELASLDTRALWARFGGADIVAESYYERCEFTSGGTASPILLGENDYLSTDVVFKTSKINENSTGSTSVSVGIPDCQFLDCIGVNDIKSTFDVNTGGGGLIVRGGDYKGGVSGVLAILDAGVEGFKLTDAKVDGFQRVLQGAAGDASTATKRITIEGNELLNTNSQMVRFIGAVDDVYLDRFTFTSNVTETANAVFYQAFGVNCTNIISSVNNPEALLP